MSFPSAADWYQAKLFVQHASGFSMDALHVIAGVVLQLLIALLFRRSLAAPLPLIAVLALELGNEVNDFWVEQWADAGMQLGESAKDLILTMLLPTLLYVIARRRPKLLTQRSS